MRGLSAADVEILALIHEFEQEEATMTATADKPNKFARCQRLRELIHEAGPGVTLDDLQAKAEAEGLGTVRGETFYRLRREVHGGEAKAPKRSRRRGKGRRPRVAAAAAAAPVSKPAAVPLAEAFAVLDEARLLAARVGGYQALRGVVERLEAMEK